MGISAPALFAVFGLGTGEIIVIVFLVLLLFGARKLPELARGLGKSVSEFKRATSDAEQEIRQAMETPPPVKPAPKVEARPAAGATTPPASSN